MRNRVGLVVALALAAGAAWWVARWIWPDEAALARAAVHDLARAVSAAGAAEGPAARFSALADVRAFLAEDVVLEASQRAMVVEGRDAVLALVAGGAGAVGRPRVRVADLHLVVADDQLTASATATIEVTWTGRDGDQFDAQEVELALVRVGQSWVLRSVTAVDVLR